MALLVASLSAVNERRAPTPERNLLVAILARTNYDLHCPLNTEDAAQHRRAAKTWLLSSNREPFSFSWICSMLDMNPLLVRSAIVKKRFDSRVEH